MTTIDSNPRTRFHEYNAPLDGAGQGRLVFLAGSPDLRIGADPTVAASGMLARGRFEDSRPDVIVNAGEMTVSYPSRGLLGWLFYAREPTRAQVDLNPTIPWTFDLRGGVNRLEADLRGVDARGIEIRGGVSHAEIRLGEVRGTVRVEMTSGVGDLVVRRQPGTIVRVRVEGGIGSLRFDGASLGAIAGHLHRESPDFLTAANRLDVFVGGGIGNLEVQ